MRREPGCFNSHIFFKDDKNERTSTELVDCDLFNRSLDSLSAENMLLQVAWISRQNGRTKDHVDLHRPLSHQIFLRFMMRTVKKKKKNQNLKLKFILIIDPFPHFWTDRSFHSWLHPLIRQTTVQSRARILTEVNLSLVFCFSLPFTLPKLNSTKSIFQSQC